MTTKEIIELAAKTAGVNIQLEIPSQDGVAIIGELSKDELDMFNRYAVEALSTALHERYPARITKREDGKVVDVNNSLLVFTPQMLIEFIANMLDQSRSKGILTAVDTVGNC